MATYWENSCSFGLRYVSWYKYLIVSFVFSHLGFWSGNLFLIAPFPDLCLLVPFHVVEVYASVFKILHRHLRDDILDLKYVKKKELAGKTHTTMSGLLISFLAPCIRT